MYYSIGGLGTVLPTPTHGFNFENISSGFAPGIMPVAEINFTPRDISIMFKNKLTIPEINSLLTRVLGKGNYDEIPKSKFHSLDTKFGSISTKVKAGKEDEAITKIRKESAVKLANRNSLNTTGNFLDFYKNQGAVCKKPKCPPGQVPEVWTSRSGKGARCPVYKGCKKATSFMDFIANQGAICSMAIN